MTHSVAFADRASIHESEHVADGEAEAVLEAHANFVVGVAHDLRNRLTVIEGRLQLAKRKAVDVAVLQELELIEGSTRRLDAQVEFLGDVTLLETGRRLPLRMVRFDLRRLLADLVAEQERADRHIRFETRMRHPIIVGDEHRLSAVFENLLDNAITYGGKGGEISVTLSPAPGRRLAISVRDQGVGIPEADLPHVFDRFFRGSNVGRASGDGIGLAAAARVVHQHGGEIAVDSRVGEGSTFTVWLRREAASAPPRPRDHHH